MRPCPHPFGATAFPSAMASLPIVVLPGLLLIGVPVERSSFRSAHLSKSLPCTTIDSISLPSHWMSLYPAGSRDVTLTPGLSSSTTSTTCIPGFLSLMQTQTRPLLFGVATTVGFTWWGLFVLYYVARWVMASGTLVPSRDAYAGYCAVAIVSIISMELLYFVRQGKRWAWFLSQLMALLAVASFALAWTKSDVQTNATLPMLPRLAVMFISTPFNVFILLWPLLHTKKVRLFFRQQSITETTDAGEPVNDAQPEQRTD